MSEFDKKISQLTAGGNAQATDELPIARSGANFKVTGADIAAAADKLGLVEAYRLKSTGIITDATTSRTLSATDNGKVLYFTSSSAITVTTATGLGAGFSCLIVQGGTGQVTVNQGSSTTRVSFGSYTKTAGQYALINVVCPVADTFILGGQLA